MSVLPDASTYESLGGAIVDYDAIVDPTTDLPASADCEARANVAAMTRTVGRVWFNWSNDGTDGSIVSFDSVIGNSAVNYPTIAKITTGQWHFTFPANAVDVTGVTRAWSFKTRKGQRTAYLAASCASQDAHAKLV